MAFSRCHPSRSVGRSVAVRLHQECKESFKRRHLAGVVAMKVTPGSLVERVRQMQRMSEKIQNEFEGEREHVSSSRLRKGQYFLRMFM